MKKETDLQKVKEIAGTMLMTPIHTTLYSPVIVQHPFTTSGITAVNGKDRFETVDITSSNDALNEWRAYVRKCIDRAEDAYGVYILVSKNAKC